MKKLAIAAMCLLPLSVQAELTLDEAQIRSNLNGFSALADQGAFEYLGRLLAPEVRVDYTQLFGGEASAVARKTLMQQWANFLPGFDATFHDVGRAEISIKGNSASAKVPFTASHWLGEDGFWAISGDYDFQLQQTGSNWVISSITLNYGEEKGSRDILSKVADSAQENHTLWEAAVLRLD